MELSVVWKVLADEEKKCGAAFSTAGCSEVNNLHLIPVSSPRSKLVAITSYF